MIRATMNRVPLLVGVAACTLALAPCVTQAQEPQIGAAKDVPTVIHACYIPTTGLIYRIKAEGLPDTCRMGEHIAFHWAVSTDVRPTPLPPSAVAPKEMTDEPKPSAGIAAGTSTALVGSRMSWDANKGAFRAGQVDGAQWDDANVGSRSAAIGWNTTASGDASTAMGRDSRAENHYATAMGHDTKAAGQASTAMNGKTEALGGNSTAMGFGTTARSYVSLALGRYNLDEGNTNTWIDADPLLTVGNGTSSNRKNALTLLKNGDLTVAGKFIGDGSGLTTVPAAVHDLGGWNTAVGLGALTKNTTGITYNTATGTFALYNNTTGYWNTAMGSYALYQNQTGHSNTATGSGALQNNKANLNTATGRNALHKNTTGYRNVAIGLNALYNNVSGEYNTAVGVEALYHSTGIGNTALGNYAGRNATSGNGNIFISNSGLATDNLVIKIGSQGSHTSTFIAGIAGTNVSGAAVFVDATTGQLGVVTSSARYKRDIADMAGASERLLDLRAVTFRYKQASRDGEKPLQFGLIAEEVAEVFPELVVYNDQGQPETVKYHLLSTLLLNELQKQQTEIATMRTDNERLTAMVVDLAAMVQQLQVDMAGIQQ